MLYLKIMKVPVQDGVRDVEVSGVIAVVTDKICGLVQKKRRRPEDHKADGEQQEQFSPPWSSVNGPRDSPRLLGLHFRHPVPHYDFCGQLTCPPLL